MTTLRTRRRRAAVLIGAGALTAAVWLVSLGLTAYWSSERLGFAVFYGVVQAHWIHTPEQVRPRAFPRGWAVLYPDWQLIALPTYTSEPEFTSVRLPLWPLALVCSALGAWLYYRARSGPPGSCVFCRYDRAALPEDSPCPECGQRPAPPRARTP